MRTDNRGKGIWRTWIMKMGVLLLIMLFMAESSFTAKAAPLRKTDTVSAGPGNIMVSVPGYFEKKDLEKAIERVNEIRQEACRNEYVNPSSGSKLTMADYVPIKWSGDLEWIAQTRAAEALVCEEHTRPNGDNCFSVSYNGVGSHSEVLAWGSDTILGSINQWYEEKGAWVRQDSSAVTGHYTSMIDPENLFMGMACFGNRYGAYCASAGEFSGRSDLAEYRQNFYGDCIQQMEVTVSSLRNPEIIYTATSTAVGGTLQLQVMDTVSYDGFMNPVIPVLPSQTAVWSSSKAAVATVSQDGVVTGVGSGSAVIKAAFPDGRSASIKITVSKPKVGTRLEKGDDSYRITKVGKTVEYLGSRTQGLSVVVIPATVKLGNATYKVTSIAKKAFAGNQALVRVTIGKNIEVIGNGAFMNCPNLETVVIPGRVRKIGQQAFAACSNLKKVTIRSKNLTAGNVGKKAFAKSPIRTVRVPRGKKAAYKALLRKKGLNKRAKVR